MCVLQGEGAEIAYVDGVDANVNDDGAGLDPVALDELGPATGSDHDVGHLDELSWVWGSSSAR